MATPQDKSHRRYNPLTGQYILCSPHRALRPWQGSEESGINIEKPVYDSKCYLCPGNTRVNGNKKNPNYKNVFLFDNDFPALTLEKEGEGEKEKKIEIENNKESNLLKFTKVAGNSHVICYTEKHDLTMATLSVEEIVLITKAWKELFLNYKNTKMNYLQIFENKGEAMGCSNPHPHGQAWCSDFIPEHSRLEFLNMKVYKNRTNGKCMLCDLVQLELKNKIRVLDENEDFISIVPYWATWPFEILLLSKHHINNIAQMKEHQLLNLAKILKLITVRYDNLFQCEFPYSMGIHQSPLNEKDECFGLAHFHMHFYPPLLRSSKIKKWMVGFEMLGEAQRDITPEQAAEKLQALSIIHYKLTKSNKL
ncbi:galactose-1-phosphate uridylyltransferase [Neoconidiobolus thromboides FSU 785]|nr:galactose-1-phosphate uridylyltransferase [Neoconidiobolus thromboides FSU 785]